MCLEDTVEASCDRALDNIITRTKAINNGETEGKSHDISYLLAGSIKEENTGTR